MKTPQKTNKQKRPRARFRIRLVLVMSILVLAMVLSSGWKLWRLHVKVSDQLAQLNQEKTLLLQQEKNLRDEIEQLNTPSYIEKLAREQLGLVKKGEILISPKN